MTRFLGALILPAVACSVPVARAFAREVLRVGGASGDAVDSALYVVCELVTNAVVHGSPHPHGRVKVRLIMCPDGVAHLEVIDQGLGVGPRLRAVTDEEEGGRGLVLVDVLSAAWGVRELRKGRSVWAHLTMRGVA